MSDDTVDNTNKKSKTRRTISAKEWRAYHAAWKESPLSKARFCEKHQLNIDNFYYWCKRIRDEQSPIAPKSFAPVMSSASEVVHPETIAVEFFLPNQTRLRFSVKETRLMSFIQEVCDAVTVIR